MAKYKKKITSPMEYSEFKEGIRDLPIMKQAFLTILFFAGVRVSEALALNSKDIRCVQDFVYIDFFRLKGSKQTDPIPLPKIDALSWLCSQEGKLFPFCRMTAFRLVKSVFPDLYPHYFRANRFTKISEEHGDAYVYSFTGICANSIDHYRQKVDIKKVGLSLFKEIT